MASFGQSSFASDGRHTRWTTKAANRVRKHQFQVLVNPPDHTPPNPIQTRSAPKRPLSDVTNTANNGASLRKRRGPQVGSKYRQRGQRAPSANINPTPYNPTPPAPVVLPSPQEPRRYIRIVNRVLLSSQPLPQEDGDDDNDFDDPPPRRPYTGLFDDEWENIEEEETRQPVKSHTSGPRTARVQEEETRQMTRSRRSGPRNTRDGRSLGPDYMVARRKDMEPGLHELRRLRDDDNVCPSCHAYRYPGECRGRPGEKEYWHCCANGRINPDMMTSEMNPAAVADMAEGPEKEEARRRDEDLKYLDDLLYRTDDSGTRRDKRSKRFHENIVMYNNLLSFTSEGAKIDEKHSTWATFRVMVAVYHLLGALLAEPGD
ncbi:MAG: hypothetical protein Q9223_006944 [Gallowayella weberi]